jgi:hypothetical protein
MAWGSTAPAVITGVVATLDAAVDARVLDTTIVSDASTSETVNIGYQNDDQPAIEAQVNLEGQGANPDREQYTIHCAVRVQKSKDIVAARQRAFDLLGQCGAAIKANKTVGVPGVLMAHISGWALLPQLGRTGALATVLFDIDIDAFTTR